MSHMAASIGYEEGKQAYLDGVPRYKCRFTEEALIEWWQDGWDVACKEHELFTENQRLKGENDTMRQEMQDVGENLVVLKGIHDDIKNESSSLLDRLDIKDRERESVLYDLNDLLVYTHGLGKITFSREKMETRIRKVVRHIQEGVTRQQ